jgi:hypothetical protein
MSLNYLNLDEQTRALMRDEISRDVAQGTLFISTRLSAGAADQWTDLLQQAASAGDDDSLARLLEADGRLNQFEQRRKPTGGMTTVKVPSTAGATLAEGEFNRFYIRALCRRAIDSGIPELIVYRAKGVTSPRPESERKIGSGIAPKQLLEDLRANPGVDTALGLPAGPNSGLSVRLP